MKIGEAHKTRSSSLQSANTIGAPMPPAPIVMADRTQKKNTRNIIYILLAHSVWSALPIAGTRQTDGKNLVWFGEIERKLVKLSKTTFTYRSSS
jgi:hypothetical protein